MRIFLHSRITRFVLIFIVVLGAAYTTRYYVFAASVPHPHIDSPSSGLTVEVWADHNAIDWSNATVCSYKYDNGTVMQVPQCGINDVPPPDTSGVHTLTIFAKNSNGTGQESKTFTYSPVFAGGIGTENDPLQITSCAQLEHINNNLDDDYILENDLSCASEPFPISPVGGDSFSGTFNGGGHTIDYNLDHVPGGDNTDNVGLFGSVLNGFIENLTANVIGGAPLTGSSNLGVLIANASAVLLRNVSSSTDVMSVGGSGVGGLVGSITNGIYVFDDVTYTGSVSGGTGDDDRFGDNYDPTGGPSISIDGIQDGDVVTKVWSNQISQINTGDSNVCISSVDGNNFIFDCTSNSLPAPTRGAATLVVEGATSDGVSSTSVNFTYDPAIANWDLDDVTGEKDSSGIAFAPSSTMSLFADTTPTTARDVSGGGNTGTFVGSPTWFNPGVDRGALNFDGSSYVSTPLVVPESGSGTISLWADPTSTGDFVSPAGWKHEVGDGGYILLDEGTGNWRAVFKPDANGADEANVTATDPIVLNQWTHLVMTWEQSGSDYTIHLYVNGVDQGSTTWSGSFSNDMQTFAFGTAGVTADNNFTGNLDELKVYDIAFSSDAVTGLFSSEAPPNPLAGAVKITVLDTDSNPVGNATVSITCGTSGTFNTYGVLGVTNSSGMLEARASNIGWCFGSGIPSFRVQKAGYLIETISPPATWYDDINPEDSNTFHDGSDNTYEVDNLTRVTSFSGDGTGTTDDPYLITSCDELQEINGDPTAAYKLTTDLTCTSENDFFPLTRSMDVNGNPSNPAPGYIGFTGTLDGNHKAIIFNINIQDEAQAKPDVLGLFSYLGPGSVVKDLTLHTAVPIVAGGAAGALAGFAQGSIITNVSSDVAIRGISTGDTSFQTSAIGGLVGILLSNDQGTLQNTFSNNTYSGIITLLGSDDENNESVTNFIGGLAGEAEVATMSNNTFSGTIAGTYAAQGEGFVGLGTLYNVGGITGDGFNLVAFSNNTTTSESSISLNSINSQQYIGMLAGTMDTVTDVADHNNAGGSLILSSNTNGVQNVGGAIGLLSNVDLEDSAATVAVSVTFSDESQNSDHIGGFVGIGSAFTFNNNSATGSVSVMGDNTDPDNGTAYLNAIGGLLGGCDGGGVCTIETSHATGDITISAPEGMNYVGGLAGYDGSGFSPLNDSYATSAVSATMTGTSTNGSIGYIGGLVGDYDGFTDTTNSGNSSVRHTYSTGNVTVISHGGEIFNVGGLYGDIFDADLDQSFATGNVTATDDNPDNGYVIDIAGLAGSYNTGGTVSNSYATGNVTINNSGHPGIGDGEEDLGSAGGAFAGFLGDVVEVGAINNSYSTGTLTYNNTGADDGLAIIIAGFASDIYNDTETDTAFNNDFSTSQVLTPHGGVAHVAAFAVPENGEFGDDIPNPVDFSNNFYAPLGELGCTDVGDVDGCSSAPSSQFIDNTSNDPFAGNWNFDSIWQTSEAYPQLQFHPLIADSGSGGAFSGEGDGSTIPYQITSCAQLQEINNDLTAKYQLTTDLTCTGGSDFFPLARVMDTAGTPTNLDPSFAGFTGTFDGQNHSLTYAINIPNDGQDTANYIGLFGLLGEGSTVKDLTLHTTSPVSGDMFVGALAGATFNEVTIQNISSDASIVGTSGTDGYTEFIGGLVGFVDLYTNPDYDSATSTVSDNTYSGTITISKNDDSGNDSVGGIAGEIDYSTITGNTFSGSIIDTDNGIYDIGGIVGEDGIEEEGFSNNITTPQSSIVITSSGVVRQVGMLGGAIDTIVDVAHGNVAGGTMQITAGTDNELDQVGGAFGFINQSDIEDSSADVTMTLEGGQPNNNTGQAVGGFIGYIQGSTTINNDSASAGISLTASDSGAQIKNVGGLIGVACSGGGGDNCTITNSHATGAATVSADSSVSGIGGLIGSLCDGGSDCSLANTYATGNVQATVNNPASSNGMSLIGGLVGFYSGTSDGGASTVTQNYATGNVTVIDHDGGGVGEIGGLFGAAVNANIDQAFNTGDVTVTADLPHNAYVYSVGGLIGDYEEQSIGSNIFLNNAYNTGNVTINNTGAPLVGDDTDDSADSIAGLVGQDSGEIQINSAYSAGKITYNNTGTDGGLAEGIGGIIGEPINAGFNNDFTVSKITTSPQVSGIGAFNGFDFGGLQYSNSFYAPSDNLACTSTGDVDGCTSAPASQFINNSTNAPFADDNWDFDTIWQISDAYPVLSFHPIVFIPDNSDDTPPQNSGGSSGGGSSSSSSSRGGFSGGGGTPIITNPVVVCPVGDTFSAATGKRCTAFSGVTPPATSTGSYRFPRTLKSGMIGPDVKILQQFLNAHGAIVSTTGAGSSGNESTAFAAKTKAALMKYQKAHGLQSDGILGPKSAGYIENVMNS